MIKGNSKLRGEGDSNLVGITQVHLLAEAMDDNQSFADKVELVRMFEPELKLKADCFKEWYQASFYPDRSVKNTYLESGLVKCATVSDYTTVDMAANFLKLDAMSLIDDYLVQTANHNRDLSVREAVSNTAVTFDGCKRDNSFICRTEVAKAILFLKDCVIGDQLSFVNTVAIIRILENKMGYDSICFRETVDGCFLKTGLTNLISHQQANELAIVLTLDPNKKIEDLGQEFTSCEALDNAGFDLDNAAQGVLEVVAGYAINDFVDCIL
jgi:hypothetical protein